MPHKKAKVFWNFALVLFIFTVLAVSSCRTSPPILGLHEREVQARLYSGDSDFIIQAELPQDFSHAVAEMSELSRIHPAAAFYSGLLVGSDGGSSGGTTRIQMLLFSAALESPSPPTQREARNRLLPLILETSEPHYVKEFLEFISADTLRFNEHSLLLHAASLFRLAAYNEDENSFNQAAHLLAEYSSNNWIRSLAFFSQWQDGWEISEARRQEFVAFLFGLPAGDLRRWAYTQALYIEYLLTPEEYGIITSRRFPQGNLATLNNLSPALDDGGLLFFRHPSVMGVLAHAFQHVPARRAEGVNLFLAWDSLLQTQTLPGFFGAGGGQGNYDELLSFVQTLESENVNAIRYLVLRYAGRIERARGRMPQAAELFWQAFEIAPTAALADASLWYILNDAVTRNANEAAMLIIDTMPKWTRMAAFSGVLDRLAQQLTAARQWNLLLEVFLALENAAEGGLIPAGSLAQYAYIVGRAVQEGFLETERNAMSFFRVAFELPSGSFYYRTMAALKLGENFSPITATEPVYNAQVQHGGELEFLLGFFDHGAAGFAQPFIRSLEHKLSIPELRLVSAALASAGDWMESIRVVFRYSQRPYWRRSRADTYLSHPLAFREIIERYSLQNGLRPEMMFGLVRTESLFGHSAVSHAGAVGLAQFMPTTAQYIAGRIIRAGGSDLRSPTGINLTDPRVSLYLGSFYMRHLISNQMEGSTLLALKAYNGGQGRVRRWINEDREQADGGLPIDLFLESIVIAETRHYGRLVLGAAAVYGYMYYGLTMEEVAASIIFQ